MTTNEDLMALAKVLDSARFARKEVERLTIQFPSLSLTEAYRIQDFGIENRRALGEQVIGYKMGLTSQAKREQMSLNQAIYGVLTDRMQLSTGFLFPVQQSIHPKIEPEIGFKTKCDLSGEISREQALESIEEVYTALEILDSRFLNFKYFSLPDVVADNSSSAYFILSQGIRQFNHLDFKQLKMRFYENGELTAEVLSSEISGDPIQSLIELCGLLHTRGLILPAGSIVLSGAATAAIAMKAEQEISLVVDGLESVTIRMVL